MAEEEAANNHPETSASTPNSNQGQQNGTKAPKDRSCPFCGQAFTSSSLGRHLDLYIKPRNPKPPDGVHDVDEIRKIRGNITRRQPRTSARVSVEAGGREDVQNTGGSNSAKPARAQSHAAEDSPVVSPVNPRPAPESHSMFNHANWQATGVINNIPPRAPSRNYDSQSHERQNSGQTRRIEDMRKDTGGNRIQRPEYESESMWRLQQDAELGRAAEMALREVLGSLEAANKRQEPKTIFDEFDFFSLSFPELCLAILPPPSTLFSPTPFPSAESWSLSPPGQRQHDTLLRLMREKTTAKRQVEHIPDSVPFKHHAHLGGAWEHWQNMTESDRASAWTLAILRSFTRAEQRGAQFKSELEQSQQRIRHLEAEYDRLSRCQLPREYLMHPPNTVPITPTTMREIRPLNFPSGAKEVNYDAEALLSKWRSTIRATTRPPRPSQTSTASAEPVVHKAKEPHRNALQDDMIMNGSVWNIGGPIARTGVAHTEGSSQSAGLTPVNYETPPNPGNVVEEGEGEDAEGEMEADIGQYGGYGQLVKRNMNGLNLNVNGKRPLAPGIDAGRSNGPKMYRAHD